MPFTTDKQTMDDLGMLDKHGAPSVFDIYNRCLSRGGAAILEEMFRYPLSDEAAINQRCGTIRFFAQSGIRFPFTPAHFDVIVSYLENRDDRTQLRSDSRLGGQLGKLVGRDLQTDLIYKGIQAIVALVQECWVFLDSLTCGEDHIYFDEYTAIHALLLRPSLEPALKVKGKLSADELVHFDAALRFRDRDTINGLLHYIYRLDVYTAVARVSIEKSYAFPRAGTSGFPLLRLQGFFHPMVPHATPNNLDMSSSGHMLFLTGANMAGKSTFMKSVSIALLLAHIGLPVPAQSMEFSPMDGMFTTINLPDNLDIGASHFYAEVLRVKKVARELATGKRLFIVFDELFRGTNVKDAFDGTVAITQGFARAGNSLFIISTHVLEAATVLKERCTNIKYVYMPTTMQGNQPVYSYKLQEGVSADRHGMLIIRNEGILDLLQNGLKNKQQPL